MSLIGQSIGNYQIRSKLGEGGMGTVYLGEHPLIGKKVAVKVLLPELSAKEDIVSRFFNEAKAVNDIGHPNIVDIVDFGKSRDGTTGHETVYFIMEYLDGQSLQARLRSTGMTFPETMKVMAECCSALAASHKKGIVHRDLKPENIYLCPRGADKNFTKLLDFGIAKLTGDGGNSSKTRTGLVIGTPAYMSPEQCEGKGHIDHRSDVYSLGVVMYELLTGRVPFVSEGYGDVLVAHLTRQPDRPSQVNPNVPPELEAICEHALEKDKNRRFQSMDDFAAAVADPRAHLAAYTQLPAHQVGKHSGSTVALDASGQPRPVTGNGRAPTPTTLSEAAGQVDGDLPRSRAPLFVSVALTLAVAGAIGGYLVLKKPAGSETPPTVAINNPPTPEPTPTPLPTPTPTPPPPSDDFVVTVISEPPGAKVLRAGVGEVGVTPYDLKIKRDEPSFDVQLKLPGYKPELREIKTDKSTILNVPLAKDEVVPPPTLHPPTPHPEVAETHKVEKSDKPRVVRKKKKVEETVDPDVGLMKPDFLK